VIAAYVSEEVTVKVFRGSELVGDLDPGFPAQALPAGWTVRDFIDGVLGGPGWARLNMQFFRPRRPKFVESKRGACFVR
jgi:hypothetical protein